MSWHLDCLKISDALYLFPGCVRIKGDDAKSEMKKLREILITFVAVAALSLSVSSQKEDPKKPPKNPPTVDPGKKNPPRETPTPREDKKPKKPE